MLNNFIFVATPEAGHKKNIPSKPSFSQFNPFFGGSNSEPSGALGLQCDCALYKSMSICVSFYNGANFYKRFNMFLN